MLEISNGPYTLIPSEHKWKILKNPTVAMLYGNNWKQNLLTGEKQEFDSTELLEELNLENRSRNRILHLSYEAGYLFNKGAELLKDDQWLALDLHYSESQFLAPLQKADIKLKNLEAPSEELYGKSFDEGYEFLERGDSYQFNLTFPFKYIFSE